MNTDMSDICCVPIAWMANILNVPDDVARYILVDMCGYINRKGVCIPRLLMPRMRIPLIKPCDGSITITLSTKRRKEKRYIISHEGTCYMVNFNDDTDHTSAVGMYRFDPIMNKYY
jgi:hypothetical protein